ncbi:MAG: serine/threonine protein kinase, partial [Minicystis sp.]
MARNSRPAPAPRDDVHKAGDIISDRYRLLRKAGEGAMGAVWVAENTSLGSKIALKLIRPEMRLPMIVERMLREARAAARLSHSSIVRVFDLGETAAGDPYIVMEFL